jgi:Family of unknown function (DUF6084)
MSLRAVPPTGQPSIPEPDFEITHAAHLAFAASPTMVFQAVATEPGGHEIQSLALSVQVMIEPAKRGYDPDTRTRLTELFGPPTRWAASTQGLQWARVAVVVPTFSGTASFAIEVPCTYDLEVAAAKYLYALADGEVPLAFHFSGQVFYRGQDGRLQVAPVPWSRSASIRMPVAAWRAMIAEHYPGGGWIRLSDETLRALSDRRSEHGLPTFDACVRELLDAG